MKADIKKEQGVILCAVHEDQEIFWDREIQRCYCPKCRAVREAKMALIENQ